MPNTEPTRRKDNSRTALPVPRYPSLAGYGDIHHSQSMRLATVFGMANDYNEIENYKKLVENSKNSNYPSDF